MLSKEQVAQFDRDGFLLGGKVVDDAEVDVLRSEITRVIDERENKDVKQPVMCHNMGRPDAPIWQIVNIWEASKPFQSLVESSIIAEEIAQLLKAKTLKIFHDQVQYKPAAGGGINMWHQDAPYWPCLTPQNHVTAWVALDDVDPDNGCMSMVPGSHKWGDAIDAIHTIKDFNAVPKDYKGHPISVKLAPVKKGHVHFHHSLTWHGSHANTSGRPRRAVALHFMDEHCVLTPNGGHVMRNYATSAPGEPVEGKPFLVTFNNGKPVYELAHK